MTQQQIAPNNLGAIMDHMMIGDTQLGELVEVDRATIHRYRNHARSIPQHNIEKICEVLGISKYQLFVTFKPANDTPNEVA